MLEASFVSKTYQRQTPSQQKKRSRVDEETKNVHVEGFNIRPSSPRLECNGSPPYRVTLRKICFDGVISVKMQEEDPFNLEEEEDFSDVRTIEKSLTHSRRVNVGEKKGRGKKSKRKKLEMESNVKG